MKKVTKFLKCVLTVTAMSAISSIYFFGLWASEKFGGGTGVGLYLGVTIFIVCPTLLYHAE